MKVSSLPKELSMWKILATFPSNVCFLLFFTLLTRISYFMAWPFLSIILARTWHLSSLQIGSMISGSAFISIILGIYGGALFDRLGRKKLLILACL